MAIGAFLEPLVVVSLLFGGAFFNRNKGVSIFGSNKEAEWTSESHGKRCDESTSSKLRSPKSDGWSSPLLSPSEHTAYRLRKLQIFGRKTTVQTPDTRVFQDRFLSRVLRKFPFLVEVWYWALIYWVYQVGRACTALMLVESTVDVAREHALQLIHIEQHLHIFWELPVQAWFLQRPLLLHWINRLYSYVHIPGSILFLVGLYYVTTSRKRRVDSGRACTDDVAADSALYEARRRTMAMSNLIAFCVFTLWPCMPPRLLSDPLYNGKDAFEARTFGFVDTVHSKTGSSSVWTKNMFCNQYAAMPSLHFGYSLLIGLTIATIPFNNTRRSFLKRLAVSVIGMAYPTIILIAIVSTANHFILDAVAGAVVCGIAWNANGVLLNLCIIEDYFLSLLRIHKPVNSTAEIEIPFEPDTKSALFGDMV